MAGADPWVGDSSVITHFIFNVIRIYTGAFSFSSSYQSVMPTRGI